jgi:CHAD domain-containing protein
MAFELEPAESWRKAIRRIARKQMTSALVTLSQAGEEQRDEAVHETRKSFKKIRAVLRLVRAQVGSKRYRTENTCFRDAGRPLTRVRDAKIVIDAFDKLVAYQGEQASQHSFAAIRHALEQNLNTVRQRVLDEEGAFGKVAKEVKKARKRTKCWANVPKGWAAIAAGLAEAYRRAGAAHAAATTDPSVDKLHEWRKQTKYLYYQLELLRPICPEQMEKLVKETDRMGELLGDDHDLAVLRQFLTEEPGRFGDAGDTLAPLIDRRRAELEQDGIARGRRFFEDAPEDFTARLKALWKTWRATAEKSELGEPEPSRNGAVARQGTASDNNSAPAACCPNGQQQNHAPNS